MNAKPLWNYRLNGDAFNRDLLSLHGAEEKANYLDGMGSGFNGGKPWAAAPEAWALGFKLGHESRDEAEAYRASRSVNGSKGGRPKKTTQKPYGLPVPNHNESIVKANPQSSIPNQQTPIPKPPPGPKGKPSPDEILGGKGSTVALAYWELHEVFGGSPALKNQKPTVTAESFLKALNTTPSEEILKKAKQLRSQRQNVLMMPQLLAWLEGEGYKLPDVPPPGGKQSPNHLDEITSAWADDYESGRENAS